MFITTRSEAVSSACQLTSPAGSWAPQRRAPGRISQAWSFRRDGPDGSSGPQIWRHGPGSVECWERRPWPFKIPQRFSTSVPTPLIWLNKEGDFYRSSALTGTDRCFRLYLWLFVIFLSFIGTLKSTLKEKNESWKCLEVYVCLWAHAHVLNLMYFQITNVVKQAKCLQFNFYFVEGCMLPWYSHCPLSWLHVQPCCAARLQPMRTYCIHRSLGSYITTHPLSEDLMHWDTWSAGAHTLHTHTAITMVIHCASLKTWVSNSAAQL